MQLYVCKGCKQSYNGKVSVAAFSSFQGLWGPLCGYSWVSAKCVRKLLKPKQQTQAVNETPLSQTTLSVILAT